MAQVERLRKRGTKVTVTAYGEVLFMPGGEVNRWARRLNNRIRAATIAAAPTNKRPRWSHYGKPLKSTIQGTTPEFRMLGTDQPRIYAAVGSSAPHAGYVDQGTGIYGGNGPYEAKILPPWTRGSPSLYESTWKVPKSRGDRTVWTPQGTVTVRGQKGQRFFEKGLEDGFRSMRLGSRPPLDPRITAAMAAFPESVANFKGNTPSSGAFVAQLEEWRAWRDEAWGEGRRLGVRPSTAGDRRRISRASEQRRTRKPSKSPKNTERKKAQMKKAAEAAKSTSKPGRAASIQADRARVQSIARKRYPDTRYSIRMEFEGGQWSAIISLRGFEIGRLKSSKKF